MSARGIPVDLGTYTFTPGQSADGVVTTMRATFALNCAAVQLAADCVTVATVEDPNEPTPPCGDLANPTPDGTVSFVRMSPVPPLAGSSPETINSGETLTVFIRKCAAADTEKIPPPVVTSEQPPPVTTTTAAPVTTTTPSTAAPAATAPKATAAPSATTTELNGG